MKESQQEKWEKQIQKGKRHYILVRGVLGWGAPTALLYDLFHELAQLPNVSMGK